MEKKNHNLYSHFLLRKTTWFRHSIIWCLSQDKLVLASTAEDSLKYLKQSGDQKPNSYISMQKESTSCFHSLWYFQEVNEQKVDVTDKWAGSKHLDVQYQLQSHRYHTI